MNWIIIGIILWVLLSIVLILITIHNVRVHGTIGNPDWENSKLQKSAFKVLKLMAYIATGIVAVNVIVGIFLILWIVIKHFIH